MTQPYPKIQSIYKRDDRGTFLIGEYSTPEIYELRGMRWSWTEKVDGTNIRLSMLEGVQGRTDNAQVPAPLVTHCGTIVRAMTEFFDTTFVTLYGEGYGARIQNGGNYIPDGVSFVLFDVMIDGLWLRRGDVVDVANKLGIDAVPSVFVGSILDAEEAIHNGFASHWDGVAEPEGLVGRPVEELFDRRGNRLGVKLKFVDYRKAKLID